MPATFRKPRLRTILLCSAAVSAVALTVLCWRLLARQWAQQAEGEHVWQRMAHFVEAHPQREAGTPAGRQAAEWIAQALGPHAQLQPFTSALGLPMANVYLPSPGAPVAILASHFDTKSGIDGFVGANDGASTVALLLHLAQEGKLPVAYLFLDGEECRVRYSAKDGLQGAWHAALLAHLPRVPVIVLDMLGDADYTPMLAANGSPRLQTVVRRAAKRLNIPLAEADYIVDDHVPFLACGWQAVDLIDMDYAPWHTAADTPDKVSAEALAKTLRLVREIVSLLEKEKS